ncbi:MAG: DUF262 domain-containing protein [Methanobrevibacter sp.]|uniref:GmrSD restriction endonuclease domain-containing protein n=1 Tax=Methanobrevibacter sp. TaxID=66852 RepID=UPI0025E47969|nr:DUF262 domain-containing protein [Methanobrevibacter sp.]MBE6509390.1 DUF262 domain-containing protein [Methanobrevibacter sp.]
MKKETVFNITQYQLNHLITNIDTGEIALPDLQRPFVWDNSKVKDLFDSLYKGLPIGMLILWKINESNDEFKPIGLDKKTTPSKLIIDGQQRLTALYSVITGSEIIDKDYKNKKIKIAYNPFEEIFEVQNVAIKNDPLWISNITDIFQGNLFSFVNDFITNLKEKRPDFEFDESVVQDNISSLKTLETSYQISAIELASSLDPEEVSEIFVRINSTGKALNQSDFIFTLMSLYWPEGKDSFETFSYEAKKPAEIGNSSFNVINEQPTNENLLRSTISYSFLRGRLRYAYLILKGRNLENKTTTEEVRVKNFDILKEGAGEVLNLVNWHQFISIIQASGFVNENMIGSKNALYQTYALYLLGRKYGLQHNELKSIISKWFVFGILTRRYTSSPESVIEQELRNFRYHDNLIEYLESIIASELTNDFWEVTLPERLKSSRSNPAEATYLASKIFEDNNVLFSEIKLKDYLSPLIKSPKKQIEKHHIFPKNYLKTNLKLKQVDFNQIANMIYIDYHVNIRISDMPPHEYWDVVLGECSENTREFVLNNYTEAYDLPFEFWNMDYFEFLDERRKLMAESIRKYFEKL